MELSRLQREVISRCAMAVLAGGILFGAYKCFATANEIRRDAEARMLARRPVGSYPSAYAYGRRARTTDGALLPILLGVVLLVLGAPLAVAAVVPTGVFEKVFGGNFDRPMDEESREEYDRHKRGY